MPKNKLKNKDPMPDEGKFLHDLANPLCTALLLVDIVIESFQDRSDMNPEDLLLARQILQSLDKVSEMIGERRDLIEKRGIPDV